MPHLVDRFFMARLLYEEGVNVSNGAFWDSSRQDGSDAAMFGTITVPVAE